MKIILSPQRSDAELAVSVDDETLIINGMPIDLSSVDEGASEEEWEAPSPFLPVRPRRVAGNLEILLILPNGPKASNAALFPETIIDPPDGAIDLPV